MNKDKVNGKYDNLRAKLKINCEKCSGLCCVALYCTKTDGFPNNKEAGIPCKHLKHDFRCDIHSKLVSKKMRGCLAYDCFGAGQKVTQDCYHNTTWETHPEKANEIFEVFFTIFQLHQMAWYLLDAFSLIEEENLKRNIEMLITENQQMTNLPSDQIATLDVQEFRLRVNQTLKKVSSILAIDSSNGGISKDCFARNFKKANLDCKDFSMAMMIASDLEGCSLRGTNFLGADMRDTNIKNTDLSSCVFLTQMQINSAKGNSNTKLPVNLTHPASW